MLPSDIRFVEFYSLSVYNWIIGISVVLEQTSLVVRVSIFLDVDSNRMKLIGVLDGGFSLGGDGFSDKRLPIWI